MATSKVKKWLAVPLVLVALICTGAFFWLRIEKVDKPVLIASGNGRIEATEVDIATKYNGRVAEILCHEGDYVVEDQVVARMDTRTLQAQLKQARASVEQARYSKSYAQALVEQRTVELDIATKDYGRSKMTHESNPQAISVKQLDHDLAAVDTAKALLSEAKAQVLQADAAMNVAIAKTEEIKVNIDDCNLKTSIQGRVLYRLVEPGEILAAGGKVVTVLDLTDVYMTIFLPTEQAGQVKLGAEVRLVFDALPDVTVPARVSFVAPEAQFTPKEVETRTEREKLMFRIKVKIDPELLVNHLEHVKTGVPGVAYVRLDPSAEWPEDVQRRSLL